MILGQKLLIGNLKLMVEHQIDVSSLQEKTDELAYEGKTPMYMAIDGELAGVIAVADTVKESSKKAIETLHQMGIQVAMITGDNQKTADAIARQVAS